MIAGKKCCICCAILTVWLVALCLPLPCYAEASSGEGSFRAVTLDRIPSTLKTNPDYEAGQCAGVADDVKVIPLVAIVVGFDNIAYENEFDWNACLFNSAESQSHQKTLQQYYLDMSGQQMTFVPVKEASEFGAQGNTCVKDRKNDGIIHITMPMDHDLWTSASSASMETVRDAVLKEAQKYVDFSRYDLNQDNVIQRGELAVVMVFAGYNAAEGGEISGYPMGEDLYIYPMYKWARVSLPGGEQLDGMAYFPEQTERTGLGFQACITPLNHIAHEMGHHLGLPDLYYLAETPDTGWAAYQPDYLSLMSTVIYGLDDEDEPIVFSLDPWSKTWLGWAEPVVADGNGTYQLMSSDDPGDVSTPRYLRINTSVENEYFLLENRQFEAWDERLGSFYGTDHGGVILWHIYEDPGSTDGTIVSFGSGHQPGVTPVYREESSDGTIGLIGSRVLHQYPFFDRTIQEKAYTSLNGYLNLPLYPKRYNDSLSMRKYSCIGIAFTSESGRIMTVEINTENHSWDSGRVTKEATEKEEGIRTFTCRYCRQTKVEKIDRLPASEDPPAPVKPEEPSETKGEDGTAFGKGASLSMAEKELLVAAGDKDPAGTQFLPLGAKSVKQGNTSVTVTWKKAARASKYIVYGNVKGKAMKKLAEVTGTKAVIKTIDGGKLKKKTYYKFLVIAADQKNQVVSSSKIVYVATKGGNAGNYKSIKTAAKKNKVTLKKGKTFKLKAKAVKAKASVRVKRCRSIQYESSDPKVASVSKKGVIKGRQKGRCRICIYLQNGITKQIKVIVK